MVYLSSKAFKALAVVLGVVAVVAWHKLEIASTTGPSKFTGDWWMTQRACVLEIKMPDGARKVLLFRPIDSSQRCLVSAEEVQQALSQHGTLVPRIVFETPTQGI